MTHDIAQQMIHVGELRYGYKLSVTEAEKILLEIGGVFNSRFIELYRDAPYSPVKLSKIIENFATESPLALFDLVTRPNSPISEARSLSRDGNYASINAVNNFPLQEMLRWSIVDTCKVDMIEAILLIEEEGIFHLINETARLTHRAIREIATSFSRKGSVPVAICRNTEWR